MMSRLCEGGRSMKSCRFLVLICVLISTHMLEVLSLNSLNVNAWQSLSDGVEQEDFPESAYLLTRRNAAIGFSGGGSRGYIAALGQIAALNELELLGRIKYIGGISGGAWATTVVTYAQNVDINKFLCEIIPPEDITLKILGEMDKECVRRLASDDLIGIALGMFKERSVDTVAEAWAAAVQVMYLDPVGIPAGQRFSWNADTVEDIKKRNPDLASARFLLPLNDTWQYLVIFRPSNRETLVCAFLLPLNDSWPYPIIGTTLVGPLLDAPYGKKNHNYTRVDITPLYVGQMKTSIVTYKMIFGLVDRKVKVGGAIEPYGFARTGVAPLLGLPSDIPSAILSVPVPRRPLDLQFAVGASSYAPGAFAESVPLGFSDQFGLHMSYWAPSTHIKPVTYDMLYADGGSIENIPLLSFLQRKVENIILFLNFDDPLQTLYKWNVTENPTKEKQISDEVPAYFGITIRKESTLLKRSYDYSKNHIFPQEDYPRLILALQSAQQAGNGLIATLNLTTIENEYWGIPKGFRAQITFVYLGRLSQWENKLPPEIRKMVVPPGAIGDDLGVDIKSGLFEGFPHYTTLGGGINKERANLLSDMVGWSVLENKELFLSMCS